MKRLKMRKLKSRKNKYKWIRMRKRKKKTSPHQEEFYFPSNPPQLSHIFCFHEDSKKTKLDRKFSTFFNMFKKLKVNIPFADVLAQTPDYVKFTKEIMSNKKKLDAY